MVQSPPRTNPFPGLRPFDLDEEHLFFGREGQADELLARLSGTRFLGVVGTSGSGKSSLVQAVLLPSLHSGFLAGASSGWRVTVIRPGNAPIGNLAVALNTPEVFGVEADDDAIVRAALMESTLRRGALGLVEVTRQARMEPHENLLVVVDQFEELFRFNQQACSTEAENEAAAFVKLLLAAVKQREVPVYVVLTMRSDFLGDCAQFRDLPETLNASQYLIPRLTRDQLTRAIMGPVAVGGAEITPRLVNRLLNDVGDDPDQLPILQHVLMRTWDYWAAQRTPRAPLDFQHYEATGSMAQALSRHADRIYAGLPDERSRQIAEILFKCLTNRGADNREIRRPTALREICAVAEASPEDVIDVINKFRGPERSFLMPPLGTVLVAASVFDISHESLMRNWTRLKGWVDEEARSANIYRRLAETAALHERGQAGYLRDPELTIALNWREAQQPNEVWAKRYAPNFDEVMTFLSISAETRHAEAAERERKRRQEVNQLRGFLALLGGLLIAAGGAAVYGYIQQKQAETQTLNVRIHAKSLKTENLMAAGLNFNALMTALELNSQIRDLGEVRQTIQARANSNRVTGISRLRPGIRQEAVTVLREAYYLNGFLERNTLTGHSSRVSSVNFSPDGQILASASDDGTVKLWDTSGREVQTFAGHSSRVSSISFSPDGQTLASASGDGAVRLWDIKEQKVQTLVNHGSRIWSVSFSPDGQTLASTGTDGTVKLWNTSGQRLQTFSDHSSSVRSVSFSPDGQTLASASYDGTVKLWDISGQKLQTLAGHSGSVNSINFSSNGQTLASASDDGTVKLWGKNGRDLQILTSHLSSIWSVNFSPNGQILASASEDRTISLWDIKSQQSRILVGHSSFVYSVTFSPDSQILASASADNTVKLWDIEGRELRTLESHSSRVRSVNFSPDGQTLASASDDGIVKLWDTKGQLLQTFIGHSSRVNSVEFSPDGQTLASASTDGTVKLWDTKGQLLQTFTGHSSRVKSVSFSPDGQILASASSDGTVKIWDRKGQELQTLEDHSGSVLSVEFSPDGQTLASSDADGKVIFWNLDPRELMVKSCRWLEDYLIYGNASEEEKALCADAVPLQV